MRKLVLTFAGLFVCIVSLFSQTIYDNSQDGKLFFKIKDNVRVLMPAKNNDISIADVGFLSDILDAYQITSLEKAFDLKCGSSKLNRIYMMHFADYEQVDNIIRDLESIDNIVEYAERVPLPSPLYTPDDPFYTSTEWGYNWNWYLDVINAEDAWDISTGDSNIKVAVVDNAIWADHPDLTNKVVAQYNAVTDTEGNSNPPTSVPQDNSETAYEWSHGTHCAGLVGAETDNNLGIASIGYNLSLMTARSSQDNGDMTHTAYGVQWAANNGADVISMSYGSSSYSSSMETFFQDIKDYGITLVAAAGNDGVSTDHYPAAYSSVIAVGASDADDQLSSFSQFGSWVDIASPGGFSPSGSAPSQISLTSTTYCEAYAAGSVPAFTGENYDIMQGTSMACPVAAGMVGLMLSLNPDLTPDEVLSCLQTTADTLTGGNSISPDGGRINAYEAMQCVLSTLNVPPVADFSAIPTTLAVGNTVTFTESCTGTVDSLSWSFPGGAPSTANGIGPHVIQYDTAGQYDVTLTAFNAYGSDTETKTGYITVVEATAECDTLTNIHEDDTLTYYITADGYVSGHNEYSFEEFAEYFSASPAYSMTGVVIGVAKADALSADPKITLKVWDDNSGEPGNELYTEDIDLSSLTAGSYNSLDFQNEVAVPAEFYVGYQIYYNSPQDTFAVYMAQDRGGSSPYSPTAYTTYNAAWANLDDLFSGLNTAYVIYPVFCPPEPTADFSADQHEGCDSLTVSFTDESSANTTSWYWNFDDGDTSTVQNPVHTYDAPGTYYVTLIASNDGGSDSHSDTVQVYASPACDLGPDVTVCADETPVSLDPGSDPDYDYQWTGGVTTPSLLADTTGIYHVTVTNEICSATDEISLTVNPLTEITQQPDSSYMCMSENHTLMVVAEGINLTYQWQKDGADITGATADAYTINNADLTDEGDYNCIVSGTCNTVSSDTVALSIGITTQITSQPSGATLCEGDNHTFTITATGSNLSYQWKKDGVNVGTDSPSLTLNSITLSDAGDYSCVVTGDCGEATSNSATLAVHPMTQITDQPEDASVCQGDNHTFSVITTGDNLTYQWQKDGIDIPSATSDSYTINNVGFADEGNYQCIVTGNCGMLTSDEVELIYGNAEITSHPDYAIVCEGYDHTFNITATGNYLSYHWKKDGVDIGTNSPSLTITNVSMADVGIYHCIVSTPVCGDITSGNAGLSVSTMPYIVIDSTGPLCTQDAAVTLSASPSGGTWSGNGVSGNSFDPAAAGTGYHTIAYEATNGVCTRTDSTHILVGSQPVVDTSIVDASSSVASDGSVTASASGGIAPYSYVWSNGDNDSIMDNVPAGEYSLTVADNAGCETILSPITIDFPDALSQTNHSRIHIYPNPTDKTLYIHTGQINKGNVDILNVLGQRIVHKTFHSNELQLDVENIESGMYFIRIYNENTDVVRKVKIY